MTEQAFWDKKALIPVGAGGMLIDLPWVTSDRMDVLFGRGAGMRTHKREKYSKSLPIRLKPSNQLFALYMHSGEWRIGHGGTAITRIGGLLVLLDPRYKGIETMSHGVAIAIAQKVNAGLTVGEAFDALR